MYIKQFDVKFELVFPFKIGQNENNANARRLIKMLRSNSAAQHTANI